MKVNQRIQSQFKSFRIIIKCLFIVLFNIFLSYNLNSKLITADWSVRTLNNPAPGYIRFDLGYFYIDNYGLSQYADTVNINNSIPLTLLKNGNWMNMEENYSYILNPSFQKIDSIPNHSTYRIDYHDAILLNNGHYLILYNEITTMDLSKIVDGGKPDAAIMSNVLIEMDTHGNTYWTWHAIDHYNITDVTDDIDLTHDVIDFTHINSLFEDTDGNIIVSVRHLDEISKINKSNGTFVWRMGGSACQNNQFTFINDNVDNVSGFSHQHSVSILANGNMLLFDNGNSKPNQYSRAVEYSLNQVTKTATKVWEYRNSPDIFTRAMGSAFRLSNGNTLINWGQKITEVKSNNTKAFELDFIDGSTVYRAYRVTSKLSTLTKEIANPGSYNFYDANNNTNLTLSINSLQGISKTSVEKHNYAPPYAIFEDTSFSKIYPYRWVVTNNGLTTLNGSIRISLNGLSGITNPTKLTIYQRNGENFGAFKEITTTYNSAQNELIASITSFGEFCIGTKVLGIQKLISPKYNQYKVQSEVSFIWGKIQNAKQYQIQLSTTNDFKDLIINKVVSNSNAYVYNGLEKNLMYFWRVRAMNSADTSAWSDLGIFYTELSVPNLIFPTNNFNSFERKDTLKWSKVNNSTYYWIQVSRNSDFSSIYFNYSKLVKEFTTIDNLPNNSTFFWRVKAYRLTDSSDWSATWTFKTIFDKPILKSPKNDSINVSTSGNITWNYIEGASNYYVQIAKDINFTEIISESDKIIYNFYNFLNLENDKDYYWRVKAYSSPEDNNWSIVNKFRTVLKSPEIVFPNYNQSLFPLSVNFTWKEVTDSKYILQLSLNSDFSNPIINLNNLSKTTILLNELPANSKIYWRVQAVNGVKRSDWSYTGLINSGSSLPLQSPKLSSPEDNSENNVFGTFSWIKPNRSLDFLIQVSKFKDFNVISKSYFVKNQSSVDFDNLDAENHYYWRVKAYSLFDSSSWSQFYTFNTPKFSKITLNYPENEELQIPTNIILKWNSINGINNYIIELSTNNEFNSSDLIKLNSNTNSKNINNLKDYTKYYWRVKYLISNDSSNWSNVWNFTTKSLNVLKSPDIIKPLDKETGIPISGIFNWNKVESSEKYNILISKKTSFVEPLIKGIDLLSPEYNYSNLEHNKNYYLKVAAFNQSSSSNWTSVREFLTQLEEPLPMIPENNVSNVPLTAQFLWSEVNNSEEYELQIALDEEFVDNVFIGKRLIPYFDYNLIPNTTYYWRIKALNTSNYSPWSEVFKFTTITVNSVNGSESDSNILYPNPANDIVLVNIDLMQGLYYKVFSSNGLLILNGELNSNAIDISKLISGVYMLELNGKVYKLIKI